MDIVLSAVLVTLLNEAFHFPVGSAKMAIHYASLVSQNLLMHTFTSNSKAVLFLKKTSQIHITSFTVQFSAHDKQ